MFWLIFGVASWFVVGYLSARFWNAGGTGHNNSLHGGGKCDCEKKGFYWNRPVKTKTAREFFGLGVVFGGITLLFVTMAAFMSFGYWLGNLIAPKEKKPRTINKNSKKREGKKTDLQIAVIADHKQKVIIISVNQATFEKMLQTANKRGMYVEQMVAESLRVEQLLANGDLRVRDWFLGSKQLVSV